MRAWELWGGFEGLEHGAKAYGLLGECVEYLRALKAVWRCWEYLEDIGVEVMGLL